jgi:hypothetical protein
MFSSNASQSEVSAYIEDVFSTYLYTGTRATLNIVNGVDLSTKGGMVWCKERDTVSDHCIFDTARGINLGLSSNTTTGSSTWTGSLTAFNTNGFTLGSYAPPNSLGALGCSWTFRKQAKFFDVVTYTGTGANRTISHNLGSAPGCIIIKRTDAVAAWPVYFGITSQHLILNTNAARVTGSTYWNTTAPTSSVFSLGTDAAVNAGGGTYVAYLFASNAGGFGVSGTDNVITCGIYNGTGATGNNVTLNYEPQFVMIKRTSTGGTSPDWKMLDTMRGMPIGSDSVLLANSSSAEGTGTFVAPTATGFQLETTDVDYNEASQQYFYIAIRRGPMKTPTTGTSVFSLSAYSTGVGDASLTSESQVNYRPDLSIFANRAGNAKNFQFSYLLRGYQQATFPAADTATTPTLSTASTAAEATSGNAIYVYPGSSVSPSAVRFSSNSVGAKIGYIFRRAPGFFDVVCYTGTGAALTLNHNLGTTPEFWIIKSRSVANSWYCGGSVLGSATGNYIVLNSTNAKQSLANAWLSPTTTTFGPGSGFPGEFGASGVTYVAYLFATVAGVSKVGSYTGTGTTKQIDCGFTGGARFVLIKRTDSTGDWYVWDSARGIVAGNDPYLLLNSTAAEVTSTDYVDTYSAGFEISSTAPAAINANGGTFIFLAIA